MEAYKQEIIMLITATVATLGYAILFRLKPSRMPFAVIGGLVATVVYLVVRVPIQNDFVTNLVAAFAATVYSEICAITLKAPTTVFLLPSAIPLVPGSALYWTMDRVLHNDMDGLVYYGKIASQTGLGIALGIMIASVGTVIVRRTLHAVFSKNAANSKNK